MRLIGACLFLLLPLLPFAAYAGAQKYEPLSASVQASLQKAVSDKRPPSSSFANPIEAADWIVRQLTGVYLRGVCTTGYKAAYQDGRYPSSEFFAARHPGFERCREHQVDQPV